MTEDEILEGLKAGRVLRCDRKDDPMLPFLLENPDIDNKFVQQDDQYSYIEFRWKGH